MKLVLKTGKVTVSERVVKTQSMNQLLVLAPIRSFVDSQKIIGVLSCGIQIEGSHLQGTLENYFVGKSSFIVLTDRHGNIISQKGQNLPEGLMKMELSRNISETDLESTWTKFSGTDYIVTLGRIRAIGCMIAIGTPRHEVLGFISQIVWGMILVTLICLIVGVFFSVVLSETFVGPILGLIEGIQKVSEGVITHRIDVQGQDELGDACKAFNEMASQLEKNRLLEEIWSRKWNPPS